MQGPPRQRPRSQQLGARADQQDAREPRSGGYARSHSAPTGPAVASTDPLSPLLPHLRPTIPTVAPPQAICRPCVPGGVALRASSAAEPQPAHAARLGASISPAGLPPSGQRRTVHSLCVLQAVSNAVFLSGVANRVTNSAPNASAVAPARAPCRLYGLGVRLSQTRSP